MLSIEGTLQYYLETLISKFASSYFLKVDESI